MRILDQQRRGQSVNKAAVVEEQRQGVLAGRSAKSVGRRFSNITHVMRQHGLEGVDGYSPLPNVGRRVAEQLWTELERLAATQELLVEPTDDSDDLKARADLLQRRGLSTAPPGRARPASSTSAAHRFQRDPQVQAWVRQRAAGVCELCREPAPFLDVNGQPFLEVHHVLPLGQTGSDRVTNAAGLCPNCHRRCHLATDASESVDRLYGLVEELVRERAASGISRDEHVVSD